MLIKVKVSCKKPKKIFRFEKTFLDKAEVSDRTIGVSEAFGLSVGVENPNTIYKDLLIDIKPGDVIYITGDSGTGKSTLLSDIASALKESGSFGKVIQDKEVEVNQDSVLVEALGSDLEQAIKYLSLAGLNEATLFIRRYRDLSEGQKYRFKIAKMMSIGANTLGFDEFCLLLDRENAKIVAYCVQKVAQNLGATLLVATSHRDLLEDLQLNIYIVKGMGEAVEVKYIEDVKSRPCSILKEIVVKEGSIRDLETLKRYHYRDGKLCNIKKVFKAELRGETVGVIVYSTPTYSNAGRTKYFGRHVDVEHLNRDFITISRVVIHPKYRGVGLAVRLVKETLPKVGYKYVEALVVMAKYNPFFKKAGMQEVEYTSTLSLKSRENLQHLTKYDIDPRLAAAKQYITQKLEKLKPNQIESLIETLLNSDTTRYTLNILIKKRRLSLEETKQTLKNIQTLAKIIQKMAILAQNKRYYIWQRNNNTEE
ncbi:MAG: ATP-binding cassette domain-containing protein [Nitrososphaerales archaeon]